MVVYRPICNTTLSASARSISNVRNVSCLGRWSNLAHRGRVASAPEGFRVPSHQLATYTHSDLRQAEHTKRKYTYANSTQIHSHAHHKIVYVDDFLLGYPRVYSITLDYVAEWSVSVFESVCVYVCVRVCICGRLLELQFNGAHCWGRGKDRRHTRLQTDGIWAVGYC